MPLSIMHVMLYFPLLFQTEDSVVGVSDSDAESDVLFVGEEQAAGRGEQEEEGVEEVIVVSTESEEETA